MAADWVQRRMDAFNRECVRFGVLRCFKHFDLYVRGREELVVIVQGTAPAAGGSSNIPTSRTPRGTEYSDLDFADFAPASPCEREELHLTDNDIAIYLIGAYRHYGRPFVWLRVGHEAVPAVGRGRKGMRDVPLTLASTARWEDDADPLLHPWEVVEELVNISLESCVENALAVDLDALAGLPHHDRLLASATLARFLRQVYILHPKMGAVVERDYLAVLDVHVHALLARSQPSVAPLRRSSMSDDTCTVDSLAGDACELHLPEARFVRTSGDLGSRMVG